MGIVTLVSGGLDSTLMSLMAKDEGLDRRTPGEQSENPT